MRIDTLKTIVAKKYQIVSRISGMRRITNDKDIVYNI